MAYAEKVYRVRGGRTTKQFTWRARYKKPDGTWGSEPGFPTKALAEEWGGTQETAIREGRWVDPEKSRMQLGKFVPIWMAAQGDAPRGRTTMNRKERLDSHILPRWKHTALHAFTWFEVEAWARTLGQTNARNTVKKSVGLLKRILNGAVDAQYILVNPLAGRRLTGMPPDTAAKKTNDGHEEVPPPEAVLQLARRLGPVYGLQILQLAFTGLRYEELAGLHRDNTLRTRQERHDGGVFTCPVIRVDKDEGALAEYRREENGKRRCYRALEPPKTPQSARDVDIPPFLAELLEKHLASWPHAFVNTTKSGTWWWRSHWCKMLRPAADGRKARPTAPGNAVREAWEPIAPGLTAVTLRRFHDTLQEQLDVAPALAYEQTGHKYPGIKGTYRRPTPTMRKHRLDGLQNAFERAMANLGWETIWES